MISLKIKNGSLPPSCGFCWPLHVPSRIKWQWRGAAVKRHNFICLQCRGDTHSITQHTARVVLILKCKKQQQKRAKTIFLFKHHSTAAGKTLSPSTFFLQCCVWLQCGLASSNGDNYADDDNTQLVWESRSDSVSDVSENGTRIEKKTWQRMSEFFYKNKRPMI